MESINKYPTKFANLESDIYYFQDRNLIRYNHITHSENIVLTTEFRPYTVKSVGDRKYLFYADNAWIHGQLRRFDIEQQLELKTSALVSGFFPSNDGDKVIYYDDLFSNGLTLYTVATDKKFKLTDTTAITRYIVGNKEYYIVDNDTFNMTTFIYSQIENSLIYNDDSTFAYTHSNLYGYGKGYTTDLSTGVKKTLLEDKGERTVYSIDFSPSGKQIVFSLYLDKATQFYVFVANADGSSPALISNKNAGSFRAVFVSNK